MPMVSMKNAKPIVDDASAPGGTLATSREEYPYGTRIYLEKEQLAALGLTAQMPAIGTEMTIAAKVKVCSLSDDPRSMSLQITDLDLNAGSGARTDTDRANSIYTAPVASGNGADK